ncbi:MAG: hypothetical protein GXY44_10740 [Phycisphaerales bacterium]|nr:hypothetical protein [Phycisphaerales bacterium]
MQTVWSIFGLGLLAALAGRIVMVRRRERRTLQPLAAEHHMHYTHEDLICIQERYHNLLMIRRGHNRHVSHLLYGSSSGRPITLFCYTYELGFGTSSESRQWWMAIVETPRTHLAWRAAPMSDFQANDPGTATQTIDGYRLVASSRDICSRLVETGISHLFAYAPGNYRWEVQGSLAAVAAPFDLDPTTPGRLYETVCRLTRYLEDKQLEWPKVTGHASRGEYR